jgi:hypothetical protein
MRIYDISTLCKHTFRFQPFDGFHISGREAVNRLSSSPQRVKEQMHETLDVHRLRQKLFYISKLHSVRKVLARIVREPVNGFPTSGSPFNAAFNVSRSVENNKVQWFHHTILCLHCALPDIFRSPHKYPDAGQHKLRCIPFSRKSTTCCR